MIRPIIHDPLFLARKSLPATAEDRPIIIDLQDTLKANREKCVGMAANMIGQLKRIIIFSMGPLQTVMINPEITACSGPYTAEEGCLSLAGIHSARRYRQITISYRDETFQHHSDTFEGFIAQIIQHEIDHCNGILI